MHSYPERIEAMEVILNTNQFPICIPVKDIETDFKALYKMLFRKGMTNSITMRKDRDRSEIWFLRRKSN
jgi:hypothetical protein